MEATNLGVLISPTAIVEAKIKKRLAQFLMAESELITLGISPNFQVASQANTLYQKHMALDKDRETSLKYLDDIKANGFNFFKLGYITTFARRMENHLDEVDTLKALAKGKDAYPKPKKGFEFNTTNKVLLGIGLIVLYKLLK